MPGSLGSTIPPLLAQSSSPVFNHPAILLFAGAMVLLVAVMMLTRSMFEETDVDPGKRALAHWLPVVIAALIAAALGRTDIGVGIAFGTSVAALSSVMGFVAMAGPMTDLPARAARTWAFLPAAATLAFVIGFRGTVGLLDAALLLVQGILAALVWRRTSEDPEGWPDELPPTAQLAEGSANARPNNGVTVAMVIGSLLLAGIGAWASVRGAQELASRDLRYATGGVAAALLSIVLALPMISTGVPLASVGRTWSPLTAQVAFVFLNLGFLLPAVLVIAGVREWIVVASEIGPTSATTQPLWQPVVYPRTVWRLDAIVLLCLSLILIPASSGKLRIDRQVGGWLTVGYCLYLLALLVASIRP